MNINPKQLQKAMKKFGMTQIDIEATLVIIKTPEKEIHILNPKVAKVSMMGEENFQISGEIVEKSYEIEISDEDIKTVMDQTNVTEEAALESIKKHDGDLASAIMELNG